MELSADLLLHAYASGVFPMAETRDAEEVFWVDPKQRGVLPLDGFHISKSLAKRIRKGRHGISVNGDFAGVVEGCADREETWINDEIFDRYLELHTLGFAHSLEVWDGQDLVGGVYGVSLGGAFFGESMFSRRTDASKIALAYLIDRLRIGGFGLCDTQFITPHLASLGGQEIPRADYRNRLAVALQMEGDFLSPEIPSPQALLQRSSQTS
ncbi:Leucyl/phenylalanyl-tRNA--protein transferase [Tritonibacter multivorans]|uniref:Leucyl/phenylalanyl-tRNA--protein transferase n=1 Tax=Tritonibacter multivorans TaxID=928856 RepID=A0A0P1H0S6_9RHOB|nr:leucyl/phenylalanyl-tRNA--protein transferase [Tritonibacter multivorans]MDA7420552.1 leucyl/phenylalanyl-tRNA--protein transferase [Tritonibacter multivorans]CUH81381.1 Leucyl/phenylalanyl-tRNA--protein transferase [Tritonibacter multivorans]SFC34189.1 leucyl/phenylalanyl-tRNA--protein transferase [Tritonibacter multivorans]